MSIVHYIHLFRWHQPIGIWLLLWPVLIALAVSGNGIFSPWEMLLLTIGCVTSRSAGCVINDYLDRDIDNKVARTRQRPITSGKLSQRQVISALAFMLLSSAAVAFALGTVPFVIGVLAAIGLSLYPLAKRVLRHPQIILGIVYSMGIPMAWVVGNSQNESGWIVFFLANASWIYAYDTIYAMADKPYDAQLNVHSSALSLGNYDWVGVALAQIVTLLLLALWVIQQSLGGILYIALGFIGAGFVWQQYYIQKRTIDRCITAFRNNHWLQLLLFATVLVNYWL